MVDKVGARPSLYVRSADEGVPRLVFAGGYERFRAAGARRNFQPFRVMFSQGLSDKQGNRRAGILIAVNQNRRVQTLSISLPGLAGAVARINQSGGRGGRDPFPSEEFSLGS